jgi:SAM-dependent methyltransferase
MKILNPEVIRVLQEGQPLALNLGAGLARRSGYFSVDIAAHLNPDILANLDEPLEDVPDCSVDKIYSRHVLEHVHVLENVMREIYRMAKPTCEIELVVPHFSNVYGFSDPTHKRLFGIYSMFYFSERQHQPKRKVPTYWPDIRFKVNDIHLEFYRYSLLEKLLVPWLERIVNRSFDGQEQYERRLAGCIHAWQVRFKLAPIKP